MSRYYRKPVTQDEVTAAAREIAALLPSTMKVDPNGNGYRIECLECGWSKTRGPVYDAIKHAASH